ncbi:hypothetical protein R1sor_001213 [Riccia sorocarpa]|uniref:Protein kinase domain-containing protein n=1 Tax=Riccia sorocarpa TaxID=122646 RepID=A0ABD3GXA8_9MARC
MAFLQAGKKGNQQANPVLWFEEKFRECTRPIFDKKLRAAYLSALHLESTKKQKTFDRTLQFWTRSAAIYSTYKACQFRVLFVKDQAEKERIWEEQHEQAADKVYSLCYDLKGFFLKTAQLLAKPDLSPMAWVKKLIVLCDQAPQTPYSEIQRVLEEELGQPFGDVFERFDEKPLGSASVAQVHRARVKGAKNDVAVKVQHPGAHDLMMTDIRNQKIFAHFLQRFDLQFDLISVLDELEQQVEYEFDFRREAAAMDRIGTSLAAVNRGRSPITVPRSVPGLVTRRVLVMDFLEGTPLMLMADELKRRGINPDGRLAKLTKRNILKDLSSAYGQMIISDGFFQADPHPGNILINKTGKVCLLDYGQTKELSEELRLGYANVIVALANRDPDEVGNAIRSLGIKTISRDAGAEDPVQLSMLAQLLFDTRMPDGWEVANPFGDNSILRFIKVEKLPKELFFIVRVAQLLRGLSVGMGVPFSVAEHWKPLAMEALKNSPSARVDDSEIWINSGADSLRELAWERRRRLRKNGLFQAVSKTRTRRRRKRNRASV